MVRKKHKMTRLLGLLIVIAVGIAIIGTALNMSGHGTDKLTVNIPSISQVQDAVDTVVNTQTCNVWLFQDGHTQTICQ
jgi:hypothetical protein